jgi:hypothetical protein
MSKKMDLTGMKFGEWTVLMFNPRNGRSYWDCQCSCGALVSVATYSLTSGKSVQCRSCYLPKETKAGDTFYDWTVLEKAPNARKDQGQFVCQCKCGNISTVLANDLRRGKSTQCRSCISTHNLSTTMFYRVWLNMRQRCRNKKAQAYHNYGGRGITVCERWDSFENFQADMYESYLAHRKEIKNKQTTLDRVNNEKGYSKDNCTWATRTEQAINTRRTRPFRVVTPNGAISVEVGIKRFCEDHGLARSGVYKCLQGKLKTHKGWRFCYV